VNAKPDLLLWRDFQRACPSAAKVACGASSHATVRQRATTAVVRLPDLKCRWRLARGFRGSRLIARHWGLPPAKRSATSRCSTAALTYDAVSILASAALRRGQSGRFCISRRQRRAAVCSRDHGPDFVRCQRRRDRRTSCSRSRRPGCGPCIHEPVGCRRARARGVRVTEARSDRDHPE
jgi:hypothetical protein